MMEWNDRGVKDEYDVIACMNDGASAHELHKVYGERIAGLLADALDEMWSRYQRVMDGQDPFGG